MSHAEPCLPPLLGSAFAPNGIEAKYLRALAALQKVLDADVQPAAAVNDARGRYPTDSIMALKRSGILKISVPAEFGGGGAPHRVSLEAQTRIGVADSAVAQLFKIHDELVREIFVYAPEALKPRLTKAILDEDKILGLAVAEAGRRVDDPMTTTAFPQADGGFLINGRKIYTTGAAEADLIAVWAFNPEAPGATNTPLLGAQLNILPRGTPGVTIHRDWDALGQRATDSGTITFENVRAEPAWRGNTQGALPPLHASLRYQAGFAAVLVGIAAAAIRAACTFVVEQSRPWPSASVDNASDDPYVRRLIGELTADLAASYAITLATGELLDAFDQGAVSRVDVAIPVYAAKSTASRAAVRVTSEIYALMGTRSVARSYGFDRFWRNARTLSLHDPVDWKNAEIGRHVLTGWNPPPGLYQ